MVSASYQSLECLHRIKWKNEVPPDNRAYSPTSVEHIANIVTHGFVIPPVICLFYDLLQGPVSPAQYWAFLIYGNVLVGLFSVSTLFHLVSFTIKNGQLRNLLHRGDRAMIYLFIAGSYTPWLTLRKFPVGSWSEDLLWLTWLIASLGIAYQQCFHERYKLLDTLIYVSVALTPSLCVLEMEDSGGISELQLSGIVYFVGVFFFKADGKVPFAHAIWHLHVVVGAMIHYYAVATYLKSTEMVKEII
uniref:Monocyte to macrophage differentiation factor 2 n=1 Tax=Caligus rogercresseyi TaxID=217165 RepID=C1BNP5_CALRO|nr:Monocyte to macrophage differentiation factor 2 [Caligus rogercresseyi]|eukprot:TRINITY_DN26412_c0_g1_i1.p1 TRINITY_DN26412_c0_g1~~TRINITY_DN26412_c0_g1_i1.p1  ORF type:complete len:246 (+),score=34.64 TRINITY_DN26412_c0_g1_i1:137-874(+)